MQSNLQLVLKNHQEFQKINTVRILRQSVRLITHEISRNLSKNGHPNLSARHLNVFENLTTADDNIVALANRAGVSKQAMSKLVKEIAKEGYINVITDRRDTRVQLVLLTEKGVNFLSFLQQEILNHYYQILELGTLTKADIQTVHETLASVMSFLESKSNQKSK